MFRAASIVALGIALLCGAAFAVRAAWIQGKITALFSEPLSVYPAANASLPPKGDRPRIVLIGDSRIAQWPAALWPENWEVINRGIGGETAAQLELRFDDDAIALDPDVIVIEAGINDLVAASFLDEVVSRSFADKTAKILRRLAVDAANSGHRTLVATIIPPGRPDFLRLLFWKEPVRDLVEQTNADLREAKLSDQARVIDLAAAVASDDPKILSADYQKDTLHINTAGYERLTSTLESEIQSILDGR
jgi:lysophospholipase L1-like esterase